MTGIRAIFNAEAAKRILVTDGAFGTDRDVRTRRIGTRRITAGSSLAAFGVAVEAALATILLLTLAALLAAGPLMRLLGAKIEAVITRLLGVLLAALAVQFVIDGVQQQLG